MEMKECDFETIREAMHAEVQNFRSFYDWWSDYDMQNEYMPRLTKEGINQLKKNGKSVWMSFDMCCIIANAYAAVIVLHTQTEL
jgi:hypothetical protein